MRRRRKRTNASHAKAFRAHYSGNLGVTASYDYTRISRTTQSLMSRFILSMDFRNVYLRALRKRVYQRHLRIIGELSQRRFA